MRQALCLSDCADGWAGQSEESNPQRPVAGHIGGELRNGFGALADRARHSGATGRVRLVCEGDKAPGARLVHGSPVDEGLFAHQLHVHADFCRHVVRQ